MPLTAAEQARVVRETKQGRNQAARARRAARAGKGAGVVLIDGMGSDGQAYRLVLSPTDLTKAYVLSEGPHGELRCGCFTWSWRRTCAHVEAAAHARVTRPA